MSERSSTPDLNREDIISNITDSQISLFNESVKSSVTSTLELQREFIKELVKNSLLQVKIEQIEDKYEKEIKTLKNDVKKSNKMNTDLNKKIEDLTLKMDKLNNMEDHKKIDELTFELKKLKEGKQVTKEEDSSVEFKKIIDEFSVEFKQLKEGKIVCFLHVKNKWKFIEFPCCENNCVNTNRPNVFCINGNGFIQIKSDTIIEYINCRNKNGNNKLVAFIRTEKSFNKQNENSGMSQCCLNNRIFTLFYYEIKIQIEEKACLKIGLTDHKDSCIILSTKEERIYYYFKNKDHYINFPLFSIKNDDVFGCGLVYPPSKINNKLPYIFFTQNGEQIGKAILIKENYDYYHPRLDLQCWAKLQFP